MSRSRPRLLPGFVSSVPPRTPGPPRSAVLALAGAAAYTALGTSTYLCALLLSTLDPDAGYFAGLLAVLPALPWWPLLAAGQGSAHWPLWAGYALNTVLAGLYVLRAALRNPA